ncbi:hypothetical protein BV25DRAFT_949719 [Artomyces pyxidatus]|uniref:Uncharacterized protein n=1 Tax=Artomyces pyxidatus TaxID=48021 RepID=A0ACB8SVF8_9AGAM|nr:hypothetical protein BV25DRAFT_949719 [Artomyces pyxidatus]
MALTATASSALPPTPSWDETIVPALRKRLEDESRALARRISAASITSIEENSPNHSKSISSSTYSNYGSRDDASSPTYSPRPSAIPRPSLQGSRPQASDNRSTTPTSTRGANGATPITKRARTLSQPKLLDRTLSPDHKNGPPLPTSNASRSTSPNIQGRPPDVKRTRIPVARARAGSTSSYAPMHLNGNAPGSESRNGTAHYSPPTEPSLNLVAEQHEPPAAALTRSAMAAYGRDYLDDMPSRPSTDSEERPFEHWYRGEVSRNGGVGELRVGRRMEMLEIANFGHKAPARIPPEQGADHWRNGGRGRRRAGSIGERGRGSFYMEADADRVLDEAPLTDLEGGLDTESEKLSADDVHPRSSSALGVGDMRSLTPTSYLRERAPSRATQKDAPPSRIPTPTLSRQLSEAPRTPTPTETPPLGPTDSPRSANRSVAGSSQPGLPRSQSTPQPASSTPKRRAKSPAESAASAKKKSKAPPVTQPKHGRRDEDRRSIAEYPVPGEEDMENAIPTWTQPVPPGGNWDEVVLPVVARKKGMDHHYKQADGSPQQKRPSSFGPEPAPGTFGYDYSKYRAWPAEQIPMNEFGQRPNESDKEQPPPASSPPPLRVDTFDERMRTRMPGPPSPAPFSQYNVPSSRNAPSGQTVLTTAQIPVPPSSKAPPDDEDRDAGCCKCVIM